MSAPINHNQNKAQANPQETNEVRRESKMNPVRQLSKSSNRIAKIVRTHTAVKLSTGVTLVALILTGVVGVHFGTTDASAPTDTVGIDTGVVNSYDRLRAADRHGENLDIIQSWVAGTTR